MCYVSPNGFRDKFDILTANLVSITAQHDSNKFGQRLVRASSMQTHTAGEYVAL